MFLFLVKKQDMAIPLKVRDKLSKLKRMKSCENCGDSARKIEWNHALIYSGRQKQEPFAIRALCESCHRGNNGTINRRADVICKVNAITEGMKTLKRDYSKNNWEQELRRYHHEQEKQDELLKAQLNGYV